MGCLLPAYREDQPEAHGAWQVGVGGGHSDGTTKQRRLGREECALGPLWETTGSSVASPGHQPGPEAVAASLPEGSMLAQTLERGGSRSYQPHPSCLKG